MPDLGKYADTVLWSYIASLAVLGLVVAGSVWRGRRVRAALARVEDRVAGKGSTDV